MPSNERRTAPHTEAVVFDMDGVLVESEEMWDEVRRGLAREAGMPWPAEATRAMQGMSTPEWSAYLATVVALPGDADTLATTVIDAMAERYCEHLPLLPGAVDAVRRLATRWPLGLASSSPRRLIDAVLEAAELTSCFEVTISTEEVSAGKPSPVVYQEAVRRLGVPPRHAVAIEDSTNGLRAAATAGLVVVAVPHAAFPPADDALALARTTLANLDELTTDLVAGLLPST